MSASRPHPCLSCGACCAAFRVAFHWSEAEPGQGPVPPEAVVPWDPHRVALRGTDRRHPHCEQLEGTVGVAVRCRIYERRPSPCRGVQPAWDSGTPSEQCDRARARYGLAPLTPATWRDG